MQSIRHSRPSCMTSRCGGRPARRVRHALLAGMVTLAGLAACGGGDPASPSPPQVRGATYTLRTVGGAALPVRFEPEDDPRGAINKQLQAGQIAFGTDGRTLGQWSGVGDSAVTWSVDFIYGYAQDGARVLIRSYGDDYAPDTATVSGNTLTVRAQFFRRPSLERYVLVMEYTR